MILGEESQLIYSAYMPILDYLIKVINLKYAILRLGTVFPTIHQFPKVFFRACGRLPSRTFGWGWRICSIAADRERLFFMIRRARGAVSRRRTAR
jgi:hypothetical protein